MTIQETNDIGFTEEEILADFTVSDWLKRLIIETRQRDCLDSLHETELLAKILEQRCINAGCIIK